MLLFINLFPYVGNIHLGMYPSIREQKKLKLANISDDEVGH